MVSQVPGHGKNNPISLRLFYFKRKIIPHNITKIVLYGKNRFSQLTV